jgi:hypothetical protein
MQAGNHGRTMTESLCAAIRGDAIYSIGHDPTFGRRLADALSGFQTERKPQAIGTRHPSGDRYPYAAWVVGCDSSEAAQVYVIQEHNGERVTTEAGSQPALDALVNVLRGHGYTCTKR